MSFSNIRVICFFSSDFFHCSPFFCLFSNVFCTVTLSYQENSSFTLSECCTCFSYLSFRLFLNFKLEGTSFCDESTQAQQFFDLHAIWWDEFKAWWTLTIISNKVKKFHIYCNIRIVMPSSNSEKIPRKSWSNARIFKYKYHRFWHNIARILPFFELLQFPSTVFLGPPFPAPLKKWGC